MVLVNHKVLRAHLEFACPSDILDTLEWLVFLQDTSMVKGEEQGAGLEARVSPHSRDLVC